MDGASSPEESHEFLCLFNDPANESPLKALMDAYLVQARPAEGMTAQQQEKVLTQILKETPAQLKTEILAADKPGSRKLPTAKSLNSNLIFWKKMMAAAAILLIISIPAYLYVSGTYPAPIVYAAFNGDITPGGNKAVLTLANGKKIVLTDAANGELARQQGVSVTKTANGTLSYQIMAADQSGPATYNTIATPAGGQYQVILPDGTRVWLNAASSIRFPTALHTSSDRKVFISGEAYFEVAKLQLKGRRVPFSVSTNGQELEVLGTHFNINAYNGPAGIQTTLLEGSIVVSNGMGLSKVLSPGQQSILSNDIVVKEVDTATAVAWKNGLFKFENESLKEVMAQLSRWYDVDVSYEGAIPSNKFSGELYRNMNADKILQILKLSNIAYRVEAPRGMKANLARKKIIIYPSNKQ